MSETDFGFQRVPESEKRSRVGGVFDRVAPRYDQADQLMCINRRLHIHGNPEDVIHSHAIREAYSCEFDFITGELEHHAKPDHTHDRPHRGKTEGGS